MNTILEAYTTARNEALKQVEKEARKILTQHPHLKEFIMAMGSYSFIDKKGETILTTKEYMTKNYDYRWEPAFKYFEPLINIFTEWDEVLKLSGEPMRFTATGELKTDW